VHLESLLISLLFAVAAVAFIGVLNARGVWRTVVASLLALFCLGAAVFQFTRGLALQQARAEAPAPFLTAAESQASAPESEFDESGFGADSELRSLLAAARALRDSLAVEDPTRARALSDSGYQAFETRTASYFAQARDLRERAARVTADPPPGMDEAVEYLNLSLQPLVAAARDLNRFFHAENKDEERRLFDGFRQNVQAADTPLRQAESRFGSPSPDSAP
jgi:hypothetical protein